MDTRFLAVLSGVVFASFAQSTPLVRLFGVTANVSLAAVFFSAFFVRSFLEYALIVFLSLSVFMLSFGISSDVVYMALIFLAGYPVRRAASWKAWLSYPVSLFAATFLMYALIDIRFLIGHSQIVAWEGAYTVIFGLLLYLFINHPHESPRRHTF